MTAKKMIATACVLFIPRRRSASTAGLRPVAKKRAIRIRIKIWLVLASARIRTIADSAPNVAINPK